jgi:hypothetical protein
MGLASCAHVSVDPIEVKPIFITMDINVKVDRQLDDFFAFEKKYEKPGATTAVAATQPAEALPVAGASQSKADAEPASAPQVQPAPGPGAAQ